MSQRICVFGDSITWGAGDLESGGWVERFKLYFAKIEKFNVVLNLGNPGNSSVGLLKRIEDECRARMGPEFKKGNVIIIQIGVNDTIKDLDKAKNDVLPEEFERNLEEIIKISRKFVDNVIFIGLTPIEEEKANSIPDIRNIAFRNKRIQEYDNIIKKVCQRNKVYFIELFEKWKKMDYLKLLEDGLHPNPRGHQKIFETVRDFLIKNKLINL